MNIGHTEHLTCTRVLQERDEHIPKGFPLQFTCIISLAFFLVDIRGSNKQASQCTQASEKKYITNVHAYVTPTKLPMDAVGMYGHDAVTQLDGIVGRLAHLSKKKARASSLASRLAGLLRTALLRPASARV